MQIEENRAYWESQARRQSWKVNAYWVWQICFKWIVTLNVVFAILYLLNKRWAIPEVWLFSAWGITAGLSLIAGFLLARSKWIGVKEGLVRLDVWYGFNNRLSSASAGVGNWPEQRSLKGAAWEVTQFRSLIAVAASLLFAVACLWIQLPGIVTDDPYTPTNPPSEWQEMAETIEILKKEEVLDPKALENLEKQLAALMDQEPEDWFKQGSLEAGDHLVQSTQDSLSALANHLDDVADMMGNAQSNPPPMSQAETEALQEAWENAVNSLSMGTMAANPETIQNLKDLNYKDMSKNMPGDMQLQQDVRNDALTAGARSSLSEGEYRELTEEEREQMENGDGTEGDGSGMTYNSEDTTFITTTSEGVSNESMNGAYIGEAVQISVREGGGGTAGFSGVNTKFQTQLRTDSESQVVWQRELTPAERKLLETFYE